MFCYIKKRFVIFFLENFSFCLYYRRMQDFKDFDFVSTLLQEAKFGLWIMEVERNKDPKIYFDKTAQEILGFKNKSAAPDETFKNWLSRVSEDSKETTKHAIKKMKEGSLSEAQIFWKHPIYDEINLWFLGIKESEKQGLKIYKGIVRGDPDQKSLSNGFTFFGIAQALCRDFESVYYVNIRSGKYKQYISQGKFKEFRLQNKGADFFKESIENIPKCVYVADRKRLLDFMSDENLKPALTARKTLSIRYRLEVNGKPLFYRLTATPSVTEDKTHYVFGIQNIEENVKIEKEFSERIRLATQMAHTDALTGIKNRLAYEGAEEHLNEEIHSGTISPFSVAIFDVNNLKKTNDKYGHEAGDEIICNAAKLICKSFTHSPVYRIGGDEFAVILLGADYFDREKIFSKFKKAVLRNRKEGKVVVAGAYADFIFASDKCVADVFGRADEKMYENKKKLKKK